MNEETKNGIIAGSVIFGAVILIIAILFGTSALFSKYRVWHQARLGQAELARADWNRQITVREAKAKEESAVLLAQAEIERAKGVAKANKIIGQSLENNKSYLTYLWIQNLANEHNQVIYVPTENNLPILEANRLSHFKTK